MIVKWAIRAGLALMVLVALIGAVLFIFQIGPFNHRPSAAAKIIPKVQATVAKTQVAEIKDIGKAEVKTQAATASIDKRTDNHVAAIRKATARAVPADVPDAEFYRGVCASKLYAGAEDCRGYSGKP